MASIPTPLTAVEFASAVALLHQLIPEDDFRAYALDVSPATVYTTLVTLWMLTLQRLGGGLSMTAIIKEVLTNNRQLLPDNKRVREGTLSEKSAAYSQARQRLPMAVVREFSECVSRSLIERSRPDHGRRLTFIMDGTTITLSPTSPLRDAYPPAKNQLGETVWPVMQLMVVHELQSGCALIPELGAMYGPDNTSESRQAIAMSRRIPAGSLILADAGFGIFCVVHAMVQAAHVVLFRLTKSRFAALLRSAEPLERTARSARYRLHWVPSRKDRQTNPDLPVDASLEVNVHEVELENGEPLYLVTTLDVSSSLAAEYYGHRYDVEHDIRDVKVTLGIENIRAKSDAMVQKELLCSIVAYNLVVELRRAAAKIAKVPPRRLSFTSVWTTMQVYLLRQQPCSAAEWQARYERALRSAANAKLPNRPGRSYPRRAHPRRPKSTKFLKQQIKYNSSKDPPKSTK